MPPRPLSDLVRRLGLEREPPLLARALTHGSAKERGGVMPKNDNLAFLGDAVLELAIRHRGWDGSEAVRVGDLSLGADEVAPDRALAPLAKNAQLHAYMLRGGSDGASADSVLASALEALIAAVFLAEGYEEAERVAGLFLDGAVPL